MTGMYYRQGDQCISSESKGERGKSSINWWSTKMTPFPPIATLRKSHSLRKIISIESRQSQWMMF